MLQWRRRKMKLFSFVCVVTFSLDLLHHETRASVILKRPPAGNLGSTAQDGRRRKIDLEHADGDSRHRSMGQHGVDDIEQDLSAAAAGDSFARSTSTIDMRRRPGLSVPKAADRPAVVHDSDARFDGELPWSLEDCLAALAASSESNSGLSLAAEARVKAQQRRQLWRASHEPSPESVDLQEIFMLACQIAEMDPTRLAKVVESENIAAASVTLDASVPVDDRFTYRAAPEFVVPSQQAEWKRQLRTSRQSIEDQRKDIALQLTLLCAEMGDSSPKSKIEAARKWLRQKAAAASRTKDG